MSKKKTHEEYVAELAIKNPNIEVIEKYSGANTSILHRCKIDGYEWYARPGNILFGKGCPKCAGVLKLTNEEYVDKLKSISPNIISIEEYINIKTPIFHKCLIDGYIWKTSPSSILNGYGCPKCAGNAKKTHSEYIKELSVINPNIKAIDTYINVNTPILHYCTIHNIYWNTTPERTLLGVGCPECKKELLRENHLKTHEQYVEEVQLLNPNIIVVGKYVGTKTPIEHYCKKHNLSWSAYPASILRGCGCQECCKEKIGDKNRKTHNQYVSEVSQTNPDIEVIGKYIDSQTAILHKCQKHNVLWYAYPTNILRNHGCPQCNESRGEEQIRKWLDDHYIAYIPQKTFNDCKNKQPLPFDFYMPAYNLCIEYDGEQHFRSIEFFGGEKGFIQRQYNDQIKNQYCQANNIKLLRIPYFKNVEEELNKFLFI